MSKNVHDFISSMVIFMVLLVYLDSVLISSVLRHVQECAQYFKFCWCFNSSIRISRQTGDLRTIQERAHLHTGFTMPWKVFKNEKIPWNLWIYLLPWKVFKKCLNLVFRFSVSTRKMHSITFYSNELFKSQAFVSRSMKHLYVLYYSASLWYPQMC